MDRCSRKQSRRKITQRPPRLGHDATSSAPLPSKTDALTGEPDPDVFGGAGCDRVHAGTSGYRELTVRHLACDQRGASVASAFLCAASMKTSTCWPGKALSASARIE